jgi:hypothetical protein
VKIFTKGLGPQGKNHTVFDKLIVPSTILADRVPEVISEQLGLWLSDRRQVDMRGGEYQIDCLIGKDEVLFLAAWFLQNTSFEEGCALLANNITEIKRLKSELEAQELTAEGDDE